jgi:hypothetical protein
MQTSRTQNSKAFLPPSVPVQKQGQPGSPERIAAMGEGISPTPGGKDLTEWMPFSLPVESSFATNADTF